MAKSDTMRVEHIPVDQIDVGEQLIRKTTTGEDFQELMLDIARNGLLQPIGVSRKPDGRYQLLYGYRRMTACRSLGWTNIPAVILESSSTDDVLLTALRENVQRAQMTFEEEADVVRRLYEEYNMSMNMIAEYLSRSHAWVQKRLAFFSFPPDVADAFKEGRISYAVAERLATVQDESTRSSLLYHVITGNWTEHQLKVTIETLKTCPSIEDAVQAGLEAAAHVRSHVPLFACDLCGTAAELVHMRIIRVCPECDADIIPEIHRAISESSMEVKDGS